MSIDYRALTMVGILVKNDDLYIKRSSRVAPKKCCKNAGDEAKFCPKCGSALIELKSVPIEGYNEGGKFHDFEVRSCYPESNECIIGIVVGKCSGGFPTRTGISYINSDSIKAVIDQLNKLLPPHLQNCMRSFGLYTLLEIT